MPLKSKFFVICFCLASFCSAQELIKDINTIPGSQLPNTLGYSQICYACGDKAYALLTDPIYGQELWVTDGSPGGTRMVKDIGPGIENGVFERIPVCLNNKLYFTGKKLWKTDGTEAGTEVVFSGSTSAPVVFQDKIAFVSDNMLFTTNGDPTNIKVVRTFIETDGAILSSYPIRATTDRLYVVTTKVNSETFETVSNSLWVSDGTTTTKLKDIPGYLLGHTSSIQSKFLFTQNDQDGIPDVWVSDGTTDGTKLLLEKATISSFESFNRIVNGKHLLQKKDGGTWVTDGTPAGTTMAVNGFSAFNVREFKGKIYFLGADQGNMEYGIKRTDADYTNVVNLANPADGVGLLGVVGEKLLYTAGTASQGIEVLSFDGNLDQPSIVKDIFPGATGSHARSFVSANNVGVFLANDGVHGFELWKSDGTEAGTTLLKDVATNTAGAEIEDIYFHNNKMYFIAFDDNSTVTFASRRLWKSDGTAEGTSVVNATDDNYYGIFFGGIGKYVVTDGPYGLNKTDIETGVRSQLFAFQGIYAGLGGTTPNIKRTVGDDLYFRLRIGSYTGSGTGMELWRVNAISNELVLTKDINPGPSGSDYTANIEGAAINNKLIFGASDGNNAEPWVTDGTPANTVLLKEINSIGSSYPGGFTSAGGKVFFIAGASSGGNQPWITDGTPAGTKLVSTSGRASRATSVNVGALGTDKVVFGVTIAEKNTELWISDGTGDGTKSIKVLNDTRQVVLSRFTQMGNKVFFVEDEKRLWVTDGTAEGTTKIDFDNDGLVTLDTRAVSNGVLYFYNNAKIWYTYGSSASTQVLGNATPVSDLYITDKYVCFLQNDPAYGLELFRFPVPDPTVTGIENPAAESIILYPNPTDNTLYIKVSSPSLVSILDVNGRQYGSRRVNSSDDVIDVSSLSAGMYIVTIKDNKQTYHARFLKR